MTEAAGIHDHPDLKLGKRPPQQGRRALMLRDVLTGVVPDHPLTADHLANVPFSAYRNTEFGVCGPTYVANYRRMVTLLLGDDPRYPTQDDVFDLYRRSGNPGFDPATGADDNGVYMQQMLEAVHAGGIGGVRCVAFAKVNVDDRETMRAAVAIFGGLGYGLDLQYAQQAQTDAGTWDYSPSRAWGGHAVLGGQYDQDSIRAVTWGRFVDMTDRFIDQQADEAWAVIWPEHLSDRTFAEGVDVDRLAQAYEDLTGERLPVPPKPDPQPVAPFLPGLSDRARARMRARAARAGISEEAWVTRRVESYLR